MLSSLTCLAQAHHSFATYDIDNKIERRGVVTPFEFSQPHIMMTLEVGKEDGTKEVWEIESMAPRPRESSRGHDQARMILSPRHSANRRRIEFRTPCSRL